MLQTPDQTETNKIINDYSSVERERMKAALSGARKLFQEDAPIRSVLHSLFDFQGNGPDQAALFGSPASAIQLGTCTAVRLLHETRLGETGYEDLSFDQLREFAEAGRVRLIMREPNQYRKSPSVCALIREFMPVNYFWRGYLFYSLLAGGGDEIVFVRDRYPFCGSAAGWFDEAWDSELTRAALGLRSTWEPEHQRRFPDLSAALQKEAVSESFAFKYVNAAVFLGREFLDDLLKELCCLDRSKAAALKFLTWFHMITDHPISRSFLGNGLVMTTSPDWRSFFERLGAGFLPPEFVTELASFPMRLFVAPTIRELNQAWDSGVRPLPAGFNIGFRDFSPEELEHYKAELLLRAAEHNRAMAKFDRLADTCRYHVKVAGAGLGLLLLGGASGWEAFIKIAVGIVGGDATWQVIEREIRRWGIRHLLTLIAREAG